MPLEMFDAWEMCVVVKWTDQCIVINDHVHNIYENCITQQTVKSENQLMVCICIL